MSEQNLYEQINPVYTTAKSCIRIFAGTKDGDALRLCRALGIQMDDGAKEMAAVPEFLLAAGKLFSTIPVVRYAKAMELFAASGKTCFLDLPSGYTHRGLQLEHRKGIRYIGCDLPAVVSEMNPAVSSLLSGEARERIQYYETDATSLDSLEKACGDNRDLFISTEGMLMYFDDYEEDIVFRNIRALLEKHGGCWVTIDPEQVFMQQKLFEIAAQGLQMTGMDYLQKMAGNMSDHKMCGSELYRCGREGARKYIEKKGFDLQLVPLTAEFLEKLPIPRSVIPLYTQCSMWVMTVSKPEPAKAASGNGERFRMESSLEQGHLSYRLAGHLDTITSADLLSSFQSLSEQQEISSVELDLRDLVYVSSAGLRVLLIMKKKVPENFVLTHVQDGVMEILETTGFADFLQIR